MGDGSYMFANPTVCHQVAEALDLPVLVLVLNNAAWGAVRASVQGLYPEGYAAQANELPLTALKHPPDFPHPPPAPPTWTRPRNATHTLGAAPAQPLNLARVARAPAHPPHQLLPTQ